MSLCTLMLTFLFQLSKSQELMDGEFETYKLHNEPLIITPSTLSSPINRFISKSIGVYFFTEICHNLSLKIVVKALS